MTAHQEWYSFVADLDGHQPRHFTTLQDAFAWSEGLDNPTGTIALTGAEIEVPQVVIRYTSGDVNIVDP